MKYTPLENLSWEAFVAILNRAHTTHRDREITVGYYLPIAVREVLQRIPQQEGISVLRNSVPGSEIDRPWHIPYECTLRCPVGHLDPRVTWRQIIARFTAGTAQNKA